MKATPELLAFIDKARAEGRIVSERDAAPLHAETPKQEADAKPSKYRNTKIEYDGRTFDSKKELGRYLDLRAEQQDGTITGLQCQVPFPIEVNGVLICDYVADFVYFRHGERVVEDVKSKVTRKLPVYRIKLKLMQAIGIEVIEVV